MARIFSEAVQVAVTFDGGCSPNPGPMYGSFRTTRGRHEIEKKLRFTLGQGTNNRAKFMAALRGLKSLVEMMDREDFKPEAFQLTFYSDSKLICGYINRTMSANDKILMDLNQEIYNLSRRFADSKAVWVGRDHMVALFGH
jgi:ribonuclease HI